MGTTAVKSSDAVGQTGYKAEQNAAYGFLQREAAARGLATTLLTEQATRRGSVVTLPIHIGTDGHEDVLEMAEHLQDLEDAWNTQEPRPGLTLIVRPANQ